MILFLDIDGVLHPDPTTQEFAFCKAELLYELILDITNLKIVISSDWRKYHTIEELRKFIFKNNIDYYEKIIGATPVIEELKFSYRGREQECLSWLKDNKIEGDWFAIDDVAANFSFGSKNVFLTNHLIGLTELDILKIKTSINTSSNQY